MKFNKSVAVVCDYHLKFSRIGGMDRFFIAYDEACKNEGYNVTWFFSGGEKHQYYDNLEVYVFSKDLKLEFLDFHNKYSYNIIITHFVELCTPFFKNLKSVGNPYTIAVDHNPRPIDGFSFKKRLKNRLKGLLYSKYTDLFIGVSRYTTESIIEDYGKQLSNKTTLVYNGIDTDLYEKRIGENFGKFIVASHLRPSKGIQDLIRAVSLISEEAKNILEIDVFGEGPMEDELKELVRELNLQEVFTFMGSSPNLPSLIYNYSFLLQPTYMECFSLSILESLAANVPVITTQVGGNLEVITDGENGFIFSAGNYEQLSEILQQILDRRLEIPQAVAPLIENNYYLDRMVTDYLDVMRNFIPYN